VNANLIGNVLLVEFEIQPSRTNVIT